MYVGAGSPEFLAFSFPRCYPAQFLGFDDLVFFKVDFFFLLLRVELEPCAD